MAEIDAAAPVPVDVLIERAGAALARTAVEMTGGCYGRRVVVLAGPGNNGADGRAAARRLRGLGVRVAVIDAADAPRLLPAADLYIDAAFGTGLSRRYEAPERALPDAPVLAADIPSGIDGLTGEILGGPVWPAQRTVTFAALKPGLLLGDGPRLCGAVTVADIGLAIGTRSDMRLADASSEAGLALDASPEAGLGLGASSSLSRPGSCAGDDDAHWCALVQDSDVESLPGGSGATHKWHSGALIVAGSPGMAGSAALACEAALRSGAGMVHLSAPTAVGSSAPLETVCSAPPLDVETGRFSVCAAGPGIGLDDEAARRLADALAAGLPTVIDADGLRLLRHQRVGAVLARRRREKAALVLTPHDGEFKALTGAAPGADRIASARSLAEDFDAVVLLKGGPTIIASGDGRARIVNSGDARLATAGSGDVLTGMIAGRLAAFGTRSLLERVAEAAHLHGRAARATGKQRIIASDLLRALP